MFSSPLIINYYFAISLAKDDLSKRVTFKKFCPAELVAFTIQLTSIIILFPLTVYRWEINSYCILLNSFSWWQYVCILVLIGLGIISINASFYSIMLGERKKVRKECGKLSPREWNLGNIWEILRQNIIMKLSFHMAF